MTLTRRRLIEHGIAAGAALFWARARPLAAPVRAANPILDGWYADPEARISENRYWIFPTYSAPYDQQTFLDAE